MHTTSLPSLSLRAEHSPPDDTPAVSVIVPTHNRPDLLRIAMQSIAQQVFRDFEVIVVNDAGISVEDVVREFSSSFAVTLITHPRNRGLAATRNTGLAAARGEFIAYLDDDDWYHPDHLETLHSALRDKKHAGAYTDGYEALQRPQDDGYATVRCTRWMSLDFSRDLLHERNITPVLTMMHARSCLARTGGFAEYLRAHEDWDLWIRLSRHFDFLHVPQITCGYTTRGDSSSLSRKTRLMRETWLFTRAQGIFSGRVPPAADLEQAARAASALEPEPTAPCEVSVILSLGADAPCSGSGGETGSGISPASLAWVCATLGDAELVLVGSGFSPEALEPLRQSLVKILSRPPRILCCPKDVGRMQAAGLGAGAASGRWVVFLEEDVTPVKGWIEALTATARALPDAGCVGALIEIPGGAPVCGGRRDESGTPVFCRQISGQAEKISDRDPESPTKSGPDVAPLRSSHIADAVHALPVECLSSLCLLTDREQFLALGGFDPAFLPGHYADADLCLRLGRAGLASYVAKDARVVWNKKGAPLRQCAAGVLSRRTFRDRWGYEARTLAPESACLADFPPLFHRPDSAPGHVQADTPAPDVTGGEWSLRTRLWPSDGAMPENLDVFIPGHLVEDPPEGA